MRGASTVRRLLDVHRVAAWPVAAAVVGVTGVTAARFRLTWLAKAWVDGPLRQGDLAALRPLLLEAAAFTLGAALALLVSRLALQAALQRVEDHLRRRCVASLLAAPLAALPERGPTGALLSTVAADTGAAGTFTSTLVKRLLGDGTVTVAGIVTMLVLDPALTLAALAAVPLAALVLSLTGRRLRVLGGRQHEALAVLSAFVSERVHGLSTIKGFGAEDAEAAAFARVNRSYRNAIVSSELLAGALVAVVWLTTGAGLVAVVWAGAGRVASGALGAGALLAFTLAAGQAIEPLRRLGEAMATMQGALAAFSRVLAVLDLPREETGEPGELPQARGLAVTLDGVRFAYRDGAPVLDGLTFEIGAGEVVGIVAASGGGKSTLAALLGGLLSPAAGRLVLGGEEVAGMSLARRRTLVSVASQEPFVFVGPLAANVGYGASEAEGGQVAAAVAATGLTGPDGSSRTFAEAGRDASGGERQRISLARAALRPSPILVLDEATSALDGGSEEGLLTRLGPLLSGRTVVVFSHRLSTVARLPRVVVLEGGRVVDDGPPERLARESAPFRRLFGSQVATPGAGGAEPQAG